jgi:hypothetical protein
MAMFNYCLPLIGYGAETCPDWVELILGQPLDANRANFDLVQGCLEMVDMEAEDGYPRFGACLEAAGIVQPPGY